VYKSSGFPTTIYQIYGEEVAMKRMLSVMVSGAVIAVFGGMAVAEESMPGSEMMKKAQTQQEKISEKGEKAKDTISEKGEKAKDTVKKADKAKETVKKRGKNVKEIKAGKEKPAEKVKKTADEGEKGVQELKDIKKETK
jgi:hypothetical protein